MQKIGCNAKLDYSRLEKIVLQSTLAGGSKFGYDAPCCVYDEKYVSSIDTIYEVTNNYYHMGRLSIAHASSDIYAAGAIPLHVNISLQVSEDMSDKHISEILEGIDFEIKQHGIEFGKGHTIFGGNTTITASVVGKRSDLNAKFIDDEVYVLILTKPLGMTSSYIKHYLDEDFDGAQSVFDQMMQNNKKIHDIIRQCSGGATDVTGYGLYQTLDIFSKREGLSVFLDVSNIPFIASPYDHVPFDCLYKRNYNSSTFDNSRFDASEMTKMALFSGEVCGPLVLFVKEREKESKICELKRRGFFAAASIGTAHTGNASVTVR